LAAVKKVVTSAGIDPVKRTPRADLYDSEAVLRALYERPATIDLSDILDPVQEKARRDKEAADKLSMENAVRRGELARRADVVRFWSDCQAAARAKFLGIAPKLAPRLVNIGDPNVIAAAIRAEACAALAEFADYEPGEGSATDQE